MTGYPIKAEDPKDEVSIRAPTLARSKRSKAPMAQLKAREATPQLKRRSTGMRVWESGRWTQSWWRMVAGSSA